MDNSRIHFLRAVLWKFTAVVTLEFKWHGSGIIGMI